MAFANGNSIEAVSPIEQFLKWKGRDSDGFFVNYNKQTKENERVDLKEFVIVDTGFNIAGGRQNPDGSYTGYFSNEIKSFEERFRVMVSGSGVALFEGYYSEIKAQVKAEGGFLQLCITLLDLRDGKLKELFLKGNAFYNFSNEILKKAKGKIISFDGPNLVKGKAFNYNEPKFSISKEKLSEKDLELVNKFAAIIDEYYAKLREKYKTKEVEEVVEEVVDQPVTKGYAKPAGVEEAEVVTQPIQEEKKFEATPEQKVQAENKVKEADKTVSVEDLPF